MAEFPYLIYDVFTETALAGNPLAIVYDAGGLDAERMQRIAREFNLSETVFLAPAASAAHTASLRIFTPQVELPFAGHPTVGTAVALAERMRGADAANGDTALVVLEEKVGPVRCVATFRDGASFAEFDLPRLPAPLPFTAAPELVAAALGIGPHEVGFENHRVDAWSAGVPYVTVPVRGLDVAGRVEMDVAAWMQLAPRTGHLVAAPFVYCRETVDHGASFHARMMAPHEGVAEDPATGSAVAAFAGAVLRFDEPRDGVATVVVEQGVEMGRPSRIRLEIDVRHGAIASARIGGHAVKVAEGRLTA